MFSLNELGKRVKERRKLLNLSQQALALESGVAQTTIARIERAEMSASIDNVYHIAKALGVSIDYLCGNERVGSTEDIITLSTSLNLSKKDYEFIFSIVEHMIDLFNER